MLFTANDAYMREYKIFAPADCIVSNTAADNDHALRQIKTVLKGDVAVSTRLRFQATVVPGPRGVDDRATKRAGFSSDAFVMQTCCMAALLADATWRGFAIGR